MVIIDEVKSYIDTYRDVIMGKIKIYINAYYRYYDGDIIDAFCEMKSLCLHLLWLEFISDEEYNELKEYVTKYAIHFDYSIIKKLVGE